jgi:hypothetical protein
MSLMPVLYFALLFGGIVFATWIARRRRARHVQALVREAVDETDGSLDSTYDSRDHWCEAKLHIEGVDLELALMTRPRGVLPEKRTSVQPQLIIRAKQQGPTFTLSPRGRFLQTRSGIELPTEDGLGGLFVAHGEDPAAVRAVLSREVLELVHGTAFGKLFGLLHEGRLASDGETIEDREMDSNKTRDTFKRATWAVVRACQNARALEAKQPARGRDPD